MKRHISASEANELAESLGLRIQHECGGYRVYKENGDGRRDIFPNSGICPTVALMACYIFLRGVEWSRQQQK